MGIRYRVSGVGYRALWCHSGANRNLPTGAPSHGILTFVRMTVLAETRNPIPDTQFFPILAKIYPKSFPP
ncbi:MAG: hypothetical protein A2X22_00060 [Bacteroidetes bacterium GWF2_49_14]|nr:MAG: hypothetical protein A2X22_00060 [Bacteroidetes bacterium GWF2_49_14]HBB92023.1 hypothetical protein [Bacteroidales bacterium]